jgi:DNA adenine methylase
MSPSYKPQEIPRPFLKWAGGKGQLLEELTARVILSGFTGRYHEPFIGGGALFFNLYRQGLLGKKMAYLSDNNASLIAAYLGVRGPVDDLIGLLAAHKAAHGKEYYYQVRATAPETLAAQAARIIYLNKTCFNGLFRENSRGQFNVPMGSYSDPPILDEANLRAASKALQRARIEQRPFRKVLDHAKPGDFVYFDPPYHPVSQTASFTAYDKGGFGEADQRELAGVFAGLAQRGVFVLLSNSWTPLVLDLYAGFTIEQVFANRAVNSRADRRGKVPEALVRSF